MRTVDTSKASQPSNQHERVRRIGSSIGEGNRTLGSQARFYAATFSAIPDAVRRFQAELLRLIAQMAMGVGALTLIGGAVGVFGLLLVANGSLIAVLSYNELGSIGLEALVGLAGSLLNVRFMVPGVCSLAVTATIGAGATAQIGAMRINEEIDALEVMGIPSVTYLGSTRVISGTVVVIPLFCVSAVLAFLACQITATLFYGQGSGVFDHYFYTFLNYRDAAYSLLQTVVVTAVIMMVHTYYGYNAKGGPAGVGEAVGRSVRISMVVAAVVLVMTSLALYGGSSNFHLAS